LKVSFLKYALSKFAISVTHYEFAVVLKEGIALSRKFAEQPEA
jgi:hypothetical protein